MPEAGEGWLQDRTGRDRVRPIKKVTDDNLSNSSSSQWATSCDGHGDGEVSWIELARTRPDLVVNGIVAGFRDRARYTMMGPPSPPQPIGSSANWSSTTRS